MLAATIHELGHLLVLHFMGTAPERLCLPWPRECATDLLTGRTYPAPSGALSLGLPPRTGLLLV